MLFGTLKFTMCIVKMSNVMPPPPSFQVLVPLTLVLLIQGSLADIEEIQVRTSYRGYWKIFITLFLKVEGMLFRPL